MKIILLFLLLLPCTAQAADSPPWTTEDSLAQVAVTAVTAVDWLQTRYIAANPLSCQETNAILGPHPTLARVNVYFGSAILLEGVLAYALPEVVAVLGGSSTLAGKVRSIAQGVMIGVEVGAVSTNFRYGVQLKF